MARLSDLRLRYRLFMRAYQYRSFDWRPGAVLTKPLSEARIALVTTAALYLPHQPAFDKDVRGGDVSYRVVPSNCDIQQLQIGHRSTEFDSSGIEADKNLVLPLDRFRELVSEGSLGTLSDRHFSFMGSITAPSRLVSGTAPAVAELMVADGVDAVFLTPV